MIETCTHRSLLQKSPIKETYPWIWWLSGGLESYIRVRVCKYLYINIHIHVCMKIYTYMYIYVHIYIYKCTYILTNNDTRHSGSVEIADQRAKLNKKDLRNRPMYMKRDLQKETYIPGVWRDSHFQSIFVGKRPAKEAYTYEQKSTKRDIHTRGLKRLASCTYIYEKRTCDRGIHICNSIFKYRYTNSFMCVPWLIHMCDMTHSCVWRDTFICVTWLIMEKYWCKVIDTRAVGFEGSAPCNRSSAITSICVWYEWVMSHMWMGRVTLINKSWQTYEWVMARTW